MTLIFTLTDFGVYCVGRRRTLERTISLMADALGVDSAYISAVECGKLLPPECYVENVAAYFGDKIEYVKAKALRAPLTIDTTYRVDDRREIRWPENVVSYEEFRQKRWPTTSTPQTD